VFQQQKNGPRHPEQSKTVSQRLISCILALFTASMSGTVAAVSMHYLDQEAQKSLITLGTLKLGDNTIALRYGEKGSPCFGSLTFTLFTHDENYSIDMKGWMNLSLYENRWLQQTSGTMYFNPLAQLGGSAFSLENGDDDIIFGTKNINPITLVISRSKDSRRILNQDLPGPIELRKEGDEFKLVSMFPVDTRFKSILTPLIASIPFSTSKDSKHTCREGSSKPLELSGLLNSINLLRYSLPSQPVAP